MPLLSPSSAVALVVGLLGLLVLLHLLRRRARRVVVPSLVPWREALPHRRRRLRRSLLALALQVLVALLVAFALLRPAPEDGEAEADDLGVIAIIDGSASMRSRGRVEAALARAEALGAGVVLARRSPRLLSLPGAPSPPADRVAPGPGHADVAEAEALVRALGAEPVVLSDHEGGPGWQVVGPGVDDVAVERLVVSAGPGLPPEVALSARVVNHGAQARALRLRASTEAAVLGEELVTLEAGEVLQRTWRLAPAPGRVVTLGLVDHDDGHPFNDLARAHWPAVRPARVVLVTEGNRYLEQVLRLLPGLRLTVVRPAAWRGLDGPLDLLIFDRVGPRRAPAGVSTVWLDPPEGAGPMPPAQRLADPKLTVWDTAHPLLAGLALRDLNLDAASTLGLPPGARALVAAEQGPVVGVVDGPSPALVLGFDLTRSDLPLSLAFPQLVVNMVRWGRRDAVGPPAEAPRASGEGLPPPTDGALRLTLADGDAGWTWPRGGALTELEPGAYTARGEGPEGLDVARRLAIQPDPDERASARSGPPTPPPVERAPTPEGGPPRHVALALAAAALLCVELFVGTR